jgi:hypothetical protein
MLGGMWVGNLLSSSAKAAVTTKALNATIVNTQQTTINIDALVIIEKIPF